MNGVINKTDIKKKSGTTNLSGITWNRDGNVVNISILGYTAATVNTNISITGLPSPKGNAYQKTDIFSGGVWHGYIESYNGSWIIKMDTTSGMYGSLTYITE